MRVLLISANTEVIGMPVLPIGLGAIAAACEAAGHDVLLVDLLGARDPELAISLAVQDLDPEVIGISVRNIDDQNMASPRFLLGDVKTVVARCRTLSRAPIVLGGSGYSIFPKSALSFLCADMGIMGEGEKAFPTLLSRMEEKSDISSVPGLCHQGLKKCNRPEPATSLDALPLPAPRFWVSSDDLEEWIPFQTRRGCPLRCNYCSTARIEGGILRKRDVRRVADSLSRYVEAGFRNFHFVDNLFNLPPSYSLALCREIIDRGLPISWRAIVYPAKLSDELATSMKKAGCTEASLGFESGSDQVLRSMNKHFSTTDVRLASDILRGHGIRRMGFLLLGGPGESRKSVEQSLAFADSLALDSLRVTVGIRIYPFTALSDLARREGMLGQEEELLLPKFYIVPGLEEWIRKTVGEWAAGTPYFVC